MDPKRLYTLAQIAEALNLRGSVQDQIDELKSQVASLSAQIAELKTQRAHLIAAVPKAFFSIKEAAAALSLSASTIDVLIVRGMLRPRRQGRRVLIPTAEIERFAKRDIGGPMWPEKQNGKTVRTQMPKGNTE